MPPSDSHVRHALKAFPGQHELYGLRFPKDTPDIAIELLCYRTNRGPERGGLGAHRHFKNAFKLMWPKYQMSEWVEKIIWAWCNYRWVIIIGHQRASKSYTTAFCLLLDYLADPNNTLTSMATVTLDGLRLRMWSDLLRAVEESVGFPVMDLMEIRSTKNELRIYPKEASKESGEKYQIHGMASNNSSDAEGRIRGGHAPRRRIILDEANNISDPVYEALVNPMSAPDAKAVLLSNPVERVSKFGDWCEPAGGWGSVSEADISWPLKKFKDGICLHFDGLQSPNVKAGYSKYKGLLTRENIEEVRNVHGEDSVQYWALIRGWFCPDGMVSRLFSSHTIEKGRNPLAFDFRPQQCATLDPAFESDNCVLMFGQLAMPIFGVRRYAINVTESIVIKFKAGPGSEPKDHQCADFVKRECLARGVLPEHFLMDTTGSGRGVHAILWKSWSRDVGSVEFGGACTDRPITSDNPKKASDAYMYFVTELWGRAAACVSSGLLGGLRNLDTRTAEDLYARRYELKQTTKGQVMVAEKKLEMKKRIGRSPDFGDAFCLFGELLARLGTMAGDNSSAPAGPARGWDKHRNKAVLQAKRTNEALEYSY